MLSKRNLGVQYRNVDMPKAISLVQDSYIGFQALLGEKNGYTLESKQYLANFLVRDKQYGLAIEYLNQILAERELLDGKYHPNVIDCLTYLALAHLGEFQNSNIHQNEFESATAMMRKACELADKVFWSGASSWKKDMYKHVFSKLSNNIYVNELINILDTYTPQSSS